MYLTFQCILPKKQSNGSEKVSHVQLFERSSQISTIVDVFNYEAKAGNLAICIGKRIKLEESYGMDLISFLEQSKLLGAERVFLYGITSNGDIPASIMKIIDLYRESGFVEFTPWYLPRINKKDEINHELVYEFGTMMVYHDCLYRTRFAYTYTTFQDLDESMMPQNSDTITEEIQKLNCTNCAGYVVLNEFHYTQWVLSTDEARQLYFDYDQLPMIKPILHLRHDLKDWARDDRCKILARPELVNILNTHRIDSAKQGFEVPNFPKNQMHLHHYRSFLSGRPDLNQDLSASRMDIVYFQRHAKPLITAVQTVCNKFPQLNCSYVF